MASSAPPKLKKKAPDAPQRVKSAFILFSAAKHKAIKEDLAKQGETEKTTDIAKLVSEAWREMGAEEKEDWEKKSRMSLNNDDGPCKVAAPKRTPKDPSAPKRPMSAYLAFSNKRRAGLKREHPNATNVDLSKMLSVSWKKAPVELKKKYMDEAAGLRAEWRQKMDAAGLKIPLGRPPKRQRSDSDGCAVAVVGSDRRHTNPKHRVGLVKDPQDRSASTASTHDRRATRSATARANSTLPAKTCSVIQTGVFPDGKYVEEIAYQVFSGMNGLSDADLRRLDPLPPRTEAIPEFPENSDVQWTRDDQILYADLTGVENTNVSMESRKLYAKLLDRDDTALVTLGMRVLDRDKVGAVLKEAFPYSPPTQLFWHCRKQNITCNADGGSFTHHHTQQKQQQQQDSVRMRTVDFWDYLKATEHSAVHHSDIEMPSRTFTATNANGDIIQIDPRVDQVAMVQISIPKFLWRLDHPHVPTKLAEEMLPGGQWCFTNHIPHIRRPFLGPYMDISPGGGDHTDLTLYCDGTLDLALSVICGFYEIVLLRRLPEVHALNARRIGRETNGSTGWPTYATIEAFKKMGYCPKVFLAKAGQHVHIPKGCLYMIRKTSSEELPEHDCHFDLRKELGLNRNPVCISFFYGWLFMGSDACGINRQLAATIEYATVRGPDGRFAKSLAVPETCILKLASEHPWNDSNWALCHPSSPSLQEVAQGILPSLRFIVERETKDAPTLEVKEPHSFARGSTIEPHGNDYFCRICNRELPNLFFHCTGCEMLLGKDFDICADCHADEKYRCYHTMNQNTDRITSDLQHTGEFDQDAAFDNCGCNVRQPCTRCFVDVDGEKMFRCKKCSCICHQQFSAQLRFFRLEQLEKLVDEFQHVAQGEVPFAGETLARLKRDPLGLHLRHNASSVVEI